MKLDKAHILFVFIVGIFITINFFNLSKYGISWDEPDQHNIGRATLSYLGLSNKPAHLDKDLVHYGPFFETINEIIAVWIGGYFDIHYIDSHHIFIVLFASVGLVFLFLFAKTTFGKEVAVYSVVFLSLFPRFIGHAHYNSKDIPVMVLSVIILFFLYETFKIKKYCSAIIAGIFFGICLAIKINALLMLPVYFTSYILFVSVKFEKSRDKQNSICLKKDLILLLIFFFFSSLSTFLLWPSLWNNPFLFFRTIYYFLHHSWPGNVLYLGKVYSGNNLPWHYSPLYLLIVTPSITLFFFTIGFIVSLKNLADKKISMEHTLLLCWLFIPLLVTMKPGIVKYDGIRHILLVLPPLTILASIGLKLLIKKINNRFHSKKLIITTLLLLIIFYNISEIKKVSPYEGSYFNEPTRLFLPKHIENYFEIEYWGVAYREGVKWLNENAALNANICVPIAGHLMEFYWKRKDVSFSCVGKIDYVMFITRMTHFPEVRERFKFKRVFQISRYNSNLLYIYKVI